MKKKFKKRSPFEKDRNEFVTRRHKKVRVVGTESFDGIQSSYEALKNARSLDVDLVLMSDKGEIPICRLMDYSKYLYDAKKKAKNSPKSKVETKTIQLGLDIASNDINTKMNKAIEFLTKKHKVKVTLRIKGNRNMKRSADGEKVIRKFVTLINEQGLDYHVAFDAPAEVRKSKLVFYDFSKTY